MIDTLSEHSYDSVVYTLDDNYGTLFFPIINIQEFEKKRDYTSLLTLYSFVVGEVINHQNLYHIKILEEICSQIHARRIVKTYDTYFEKRNTIVYPTMNKKWLNKCKILK